MIRQKASFDIQVDVCRQKRGRNLADTIYVLSLPHIEHIINILLKESSYLFGN